MFNHKKQLGRWMKKAREAKGLSVRDAASQCELSGSRLSAFENGDAVLSSRELYFLARTYGMGIAPGDEYQLEESPVLRSVLSEINLADADPYVLAGLLTLTDPSTLTYQKQRALTRAAAQLRAEAGEIAKAVDKHTAREWSADDPIYDDPAPFAAVASVADLARNLAKSPSSNAMIGGAVGMFDTLDRMSSPKGEEVKATLEAACGLIESMERTTDDLL